MPAFDDNRWRDELLDHWAQYMPQHHEYIADQVKKHLDAFPEDRALMKAVLDPIYHKAKQDHAVRQHLR